MGASQSQGARGPMNGPVASPASSFISPKPIGQTQLAHSNPSSISNSTAHFSADSPNSQKLAKVGHSTTGIHHMISFI